MKPVRCPWCGMPRPLLALGIVWVHPLRCHKNPKVN